MRKRFALFYDNLRDYVEPEIVDNSNSDNRQYKTIFYSNTAIIKFLIIVFFLITLFFIVIIVFGITISSTLVGAIIGIPLILIGIGGMYLVGRFLVFVAKLKYLVRRIR